MHRSVMAALMTALPETAILSRAASCYHHVDNDSFSLLYTLIIQQSRCRERVPLTITTNPEQG